MELMNNSLTHLDDQGRARMVGIGHKTATTRAAIAEGYITLQSKTIRAIAGGSTPKGDVFAAARIAGIMAAKKTGDLIPLCHPLPIESVEIKFDLPSADIEGDAPTRLRIEVTSQITAKTGVEMESLTAVSVAALTIYDMCKAIDKTMVIDGIRLVSKTK